MNEWIDWFQRVLDVSIRLYFRQECDLSSVYDIPLPKAGPLWKALLPEQVDPTFDEWMVSVSYTHLTLPTNSRV